MCTPHDTLSRVESGHIIVVFVQHICHGLNHLLHSPMKSCHLQYQRLFQDHEIVINLALEYATQTT